MFLAFHGHIVADNNSCPFLVITGCVLVLLKLKSVWNYVSIREVHDDVFKVVRFAVDHSFDKDREGADQVLRFWRTFVEPFFGLPLRSQEEVRIPLNMLFLVPPQTALLLILSTHALLLALAAETVRSQPGLWTDLSNTAFLSFLKLLCCFGQVDALRSVPGDASKPAAEAAAAETATAPGSDAGVSEMEEDDVTTAGEDEDGAPSGETSAEKTEGANVESKKEVRIREIQAVTRSEGLLGNAGLLSC